MPDFKSSSVTTESSETICLPTGLKAQLEQCKTLPSMPAVVIRVLEVARSPDAGLTDYSQAIENDPALTLRLLALANSALYSRQQIRMYTCHQAVSRIGLDGTLAAVMSFGLARTGKQEGYLKLFWQRSIIAALAARYLSKQLCPLHSGSLFTLALLQDIGVLALDCVAPETAERLYGKYLLLPSELEKKEQALFGCNHASVGAWLGQYWGLPDHLVRGIQDSHGPLVESPKDLLCLRLSGPVADAWLCDDSVKAMASLVRQFKRLDGLEAISIAELLDGIQVQLPDMASLLVVETPDYHDNQQMLQEAQQHLFQQTLSLHARLDQQQQELELLRQRQDDLETLSRRDALTGLANRAWLEEQLQLRFAFCRQHQRTMSIAFIDLDHFKQLNDQYGHQVGDRVLERFGALLTTAVREGDLAGRYGGEEFLLILPDEHASGTRIIIERLIRQLEITPILLIDGDPLHISISVGIACLCDGDFGDISELIDVADQCMYRIKRAGRSGIAIHQGMVS
ncbi:MAG: sensor domain-containing diguanylate cyclase [Pseudomonadota bacterium]|jgi:diguanylate cyclase (GGDEF)-like protein